MSYTFLSFKEADQLSGVMGDTVQESNKKIIPLLNKYYEENKSHWSFWETLFSTIRKGYFKDLKAKWIEEAAAKSKKEGCFRLRGQRQMQRPEWIWSILRTEENQKSEWQQKSQEIGLHSNECTLSARKCPRGWKHCNQQNKGLVLGKVMS